MKSRILWLLVLSIGGCGEEDERQIATSTGNGLVIAAVSGTGQSNVPPSGIDAQGTNFTLTSTTASVRDIELDLPDGTTCEDLSEPLSGRIVCDDSENDSDKLRIDGPFVFDLLARTSTPALRDLSLPALTYKRVDVRFDDADPDDGLVGNNDPLADNTIYATGTFDYEGIGRIFAVSLDFNEDARFESTQGIPLSDSNAADILLKLDVMNWFTMLPITQCLDDGDLQLNGNNLVVSDSGGDCSDVENALKDAIKTSGQLDKE